MKRITVVINDVEYPCYFTLGAALEFKQETGREASEVEASSLTDQGILLYCFCKAACRREKKEFPYTLTDFLDQITEDELAAWNTAQAAAGEGPSKKKPAKARP